MSLDMMITLALMAGLGLAFALISRHAARPADPLKPRLIPWRPMLIVIGFAMVLALVHLINLLGATTGPR